MHTHLGRGDSLAARRAPAIGIWARVVAGLLVTSAPALATEASGTRSIYMNGVDISSARSQELRNVDVIINERGDIFVVAPHYQVNEEDSYIPLSQYVQGMDDRPVHKPPQGAAAASGPLAAGGLIPKPSDAPAAKVEMSGATKAQSGIEGSEGDKSGAKAAGAVEQPPAPGN